MASGPLLKHSIVHTSPHLKLASRSFTTVFKLCILWPLKFWAARASIILRYFCFYASLQHEHIRRERSALNSSSFLYFCINTLSTHLQQKKKHTLIEHIPPGAWSTLRYSKSLTCGEKLLCSLNLDFKLPKTSEIWNKNVCMPCVSRTRYHMCQRRL